MTGEKQGGSVSGHAGGSTEESTMRVILGRVGQVLVLPLIGLIRVYQLVISPLTPPTCRYYPSCSAYAVTALRRFGPIKGTGLAGRRLLRCHPWSPGGVDHVPERAPPASLASADEAAPSTTDPVGPTGSDPAPAPPSTPAQPSGRPIPRDKGLS
jgi:uncharacterized protein